MKILVLNSGSSSIKYQLFEIDNDTQTVLFKGLIEDVKDYTRSIKNIFDGLIKSKIISSLNDIDGFGHRVVHGGERFTQPTIVTQEVLETIEKVSIFAPLHNFANLEGIKAIYNISKKAKQVVVFDTAYHQTIPETAFIYPIPYKYYEENKIRRYGFHGSSHQYIANEASKLLGKPLKSLNIISVHLGNGASVCAIKNGKSIDTSMGLTPLEGLMMGTRCGDIDPAIIFYLENQLNLSISEIENILNKKSGLLGISGKTNDFRQIEVNAKNGCKRSKLAIEIFAYKIKKYIGSYIFLLDDIDAIVFTGGIGENSKLLKDIVMKNNETKYNTLTIPTNEELLIAKFTYGMI